MEKKNNLDASIFGRTIRHIRINRKSMSQKNFAKPLGFSGSHLSALEKGLYRVPEKLIKKISAVHNLNDNEIRALKESAKEMMKIQGIGYNGGIKRKSAKRGPYKKTKLLHKQFQKSSNIQ